MTLEFSSALAQGVKEEVVSLGTVSCAQDDLDYKKFPAYEKSLSLMTAGLWGMPSEGSRRDKAFLRRTAQ